MRGDLHSNLRHGGLQNDSSSGSSSPRSNSSREEILDVAEPELPSKAIYNFSIPEIIKHDPRRDRDNNRNEPIREIRHGKRSRTCLVNEGITRLDSVDQQPSPGQSRKRKKARAIAANSTSIDDNNDSCHRQNVPVIDLTGIDSHDDQYANVHSDSELNFSSSRNEASSLLDHETTTFSDMLTNLELYQQQLQNRNRHYDNLFLRSPSLQRLHRYRRRYNEARSRQIVSDGPLVTEEMLEANIPVYVDNSTPGRTTAVDESVVVVNEIRGNQADSDRDIALRMQGDPTFSPPYYSPRSIDSLSRRQVNPLQHLQRMRALRHRRNLETSLNVPESPSIFQQLPDNNLNEETGTTRERSVRSRERREHTRHATLHETVSVTDDSNRVAVTEGEVRHGNLQHSSNGNTLSNNNGASNNNSDDDDGDVEIIGITNSSTTLEPQLPTLSSFHLRFRDSGTTQNQRHFLNDLTYPTSPLLANRIQQLYYDDYFAYYDLSGRIPPPTNENYENFLSLAERIGPAKPRGLQKSDIEKIPSFRFSSSTAKETNAKCVVCISEYANREKLRRLPCSHDFHAKCIDKWLKSNKTCPVCRDEVKTTSSNE